MQTVAAVCYPLPVYQELLVANSYDSRCELRPNLVVQIRTKFDAPNIGHYTGQIPAHRTANTNESFVYVCSCGAGVWQWGITSQHVCNATHICLCC